MTIKNKSVLFDTSIIVRYLIGEESPEGQQAINFLDQVQSGIVKGHLLECVFTEIIFVLSKFYEVPRSEISKTLSGLLQYKGIVNDHKAVLLKALEIYSNTKLHIVDCILAARTQLLNLELITFNKELQKIAALSEFKDSEK